MTKRFLGAILTFVLVWLSATSSSVAQQPRFDPYFATPTAAQTVSPYLNLGVDSNGFSNYQTYVRPLLDEREASARRAIAEARRRHRPSQPRTSTAATGSERPGHSESGRGAGRFMNLSHYFRGGR